LIIESIINQSKQVDKDETYNADETMTKMIVDIIVENLLFE